MFVMFRKGVIHSCLVKLLGVIDLVATMLHALLRTILQFCELPCPLSVTA